MSAEMKSNDFIVDQLRVENDKVVPDESFIDDLDANTLELVKLIMATGIRKKKMTYSHQTLSNESTYRRF